MDKTNRIATDAENGLLSTQQQTNNIWRLVLAQALSRIIVDNTFVYRHH
ncbi:hypothetical protein OAP63_06550 [Vibrio sp.]|nr:hypothetical protein [Vibrio sp.]